MVGKVGLVDLGGVGLIDVDCLVGLVRRVGWLVTLLGCFGPKRKTFKNTHQENGCCANKFPIHFKDPSHFQCLLELERR